jgi:peptide/nickel transport system substrate-binding protein
MGEETMKNSGWSSFRRLIGISLLAALIAVPGLAQTRGGTLNAIVNPEPPNLVLGLNQLLPTQLVASKIYQGLLRYDFDLTPRPSLAKSWEISPDGKTYTFHLERNVKWHDGTPFTARDVLFSTDVFLKETHARWRSMHERTESIRAVDDFTIEFKLKEPFSPFIYAFLPAGAPMMPKHIYDGTDYRNNPANATPIGTGPFKFKEWRRGSFIHLVRNDQYWKPNRPYLDEIYYYVIPDSAQRVAALESGRIDMAQNNDIEAFDVPRIKGLPNIDFRTSGPEAVSPISWLDVNLRIAPFNDKRFRQAMLHAIDRDFLQKNIWFGLGKTAHGPIASTTRYYDEKAVKRYAYDPQKSMALLDEMGLKPDARGVRARVKMLALPYGEVWTRHAEFVKQQFGKVGIDVTIETTDAAGFLQRNANWDFELCFNFVSQFMHPAVGVARTYISSNIRKGIISTNVMGYSNPRVDQLFSEAAVQTAEAEIQKRYSEIQAIISDELPVIYLTELEFPIFINKKFRNVVMDGNGPLGEFDEAYLVR